MKTNYVQVTYSAPESAKKKILNSLQNVNFRFTRVAPKQSPGLFRRHPGLFKRRPGLFKRRPGLFKRRPGLLRRRPGLLMRRPEKHKNANNFVVFEL